MRIDARADSRAAQREFAQVLRRRPQTRDAVLHLTGITAEFLSQPDGRRVLQMGAPNFQHVVKFLRLVFQRLLQFRQRRNQRMLDSIQRRHMHRRGNDIVAGLPLIDVVVRMDQFFAALAAEQFNRPIGNDLVRIHIGRSAGTGLKNIQDKLAVPLAVCHFLGGPFDG